MLAKIVIGSFFGDEGKGAVVNSLSSPFSNVIRFNGGPQAGHTVIDDIGGHKHVFSSFCSGHFKNAYSVVSEYCAIYPPAIIKEYNDIKLLDPTRFYKKHIRVNALTPLIIPSDVINSQKHVDNLNCGYGFGECIKRHETLDYPLRLFASDLHDTNILRLKLEIGTSLNKKDIDYYIQQCNDLMDKDIIEIYDNYKFLIDENHPSVIGSLIFEGAQGTLLDREFGFFPYCTRSNTTVKNALELLTKNINKDINVHIHMVMRPYITRHGAGPLPYEYDKPMVLINNENETNVTNKYQGKFRYAPFNFDLLRYSIRVNCLIAEKYRLEGINFNMLYANVTCLDQIPGLIHCIEDDKHLFLEKDKFLEKISSCGFEVVETNGIGRV